MAPAHRCIVCVGMHASQPRSERGRTHARLSCLSASSTHHGSRILACAHRCSTREHRDASCVHPQGESRRCVHMCACIHKESTGAACVMCACIHASGLVRHPVCTCCPLRPGPQSLCSRRQLRPMLRPGPLTGRCRWSYKARSHDRGLGDAPANIIQGAHRMTGRRAPRALTLGPGQGSRCAPHLLCLMRSGPRSPPAHASSLHRLRV
jgi:hypothetical protein